MSTSLAPPLSESKRAYWLCQLAGWGTYSVLNVFPAVFDAHFSWGRSVAEAAAVGVIGLAFTHLLYLFIHRHGWARMNLRARVPRVIAASAVLSLPAALFGTLLGLTSWQTDSVSIDSPSFQLPLVVLLRAINWLALFLFWSVLYFGALSMRHRKWAALRESELARALQLAELRLLKSQLNPHFLFNALNTVRALIADEPARAQSAVTQLSRTLRYTLNSGHDELVSLDQELAIVDDYLELESLRCGDRLRVERNIAPATRAMRIPVMLLQTLVENAITHGIAELPSGGVLTVTTDFDGQSLVLKVENPCPAKPQPSAHQGIGLANAAERLRLLFGPQATLNLDLSQPGWARARVVMPVAT